MKSNSPSSLYKYYWGIVLVVLALGTLASIYTYKFVAKNTEEALLKNVISIASVFEKSDIATLSGSEADLSNIAYQSLKSKLERIPVLNSDIRFVYLWGYRDGNPFFLVDSEPEESADYSPPGQVYDEATDLDRNLFLEKLPPSVEMSTDRWGTWISGLTPIIDEESGEVIAVMGVDMSATKYFETIYTATAIPILTTIFVLVIIFIGFLLQRREEEFLSFKSELVSIASHEIRSPLTGITWLANAVLRDTHVPDTARENVTVIREKSQSLLRTINALLDSAALGKIDKQKLEKVEMKAKDMFEEIIKNFSLNIEEKKIKVILDSSITPETNMWGDKDRLNRMFSNIVSNAIKYSKAESEILISKRDKPSSTIFVIQDHGAGIPKADKDKVFKGFFRADNAKAVTANGTGLGLYYVRQIVELHGGKIWFESTEGEGTTFFIELPVK